MADTDEEEVRPVLLKKVTLLSTPNWAGDHRIRLGSRRQSPFSLLNLTPETRRKILSEFQEYKKSYKESSDPSRRNRDPSLQEFLRDLKESSDPRRRNRDPSLQEFLKDLIEHEREFNAFEARREKYGHNTNKHLSERKVNAESNSDKQGFMDKDKAQKFALEHGARLLAALQRHTPKDKEAIITALAKEATGRAVSFTDPQPRISFWRNRVEAERQEPAPAPPAAALPAQDKPLALPTKPLASWADDKRAGINPPQHLSIHYSPWLRHDEYGMTFSDVKVINEELHKDLRNWLRYRELPEDCPLMTKQERNNIWIDKIVSGHAQMPTDYPTVSRLKMLAHNRGIELPGASDHARPKQRQ